MTVWEGVIEWLYSLKVDCGFVKKRVTVLTENERIIFKKNTSD